MQAETRSTQVNLRLQPALKEAAEKAAARDHRSLTSLIEKLLSDFLRTQPTLEDWHERAMARFLGVVSDRKLSDQIRHGKMARSYSIINHNGESLNPTSMINILRSAYSDVGNTISNHHAFYIYTRPELQPYFTYDGNLERSKMSEILECAVTPPVASSLELWRASPAGLVADVRTLDEDDERFSQLGLRPGKWFCPFFLTRNLAELVLHAHLFSRRFPVTEAVEFRCEWSGMQERELADPDSTFGHWERGHIARADHRVTIAQSQANDLGRTWPEVVSALGGPVMRLFDPAFDYSPDWVRTQVDRLRR